MQPETNNTSMICSICGDETGPQDNDSMIDSVGIYCGECMRRMGLVGELILPCGLCHFPVLGRVHMIEDHDYEYCSSCAAILSRMGFKQI